MKIRIGNILIEPDNKEQAFRIADRYVYPPIRKRLTHNERTRLTRIVRGIENNPDYFEDGAGI